MHLEPIAGARIISQQFGAGGQSESLRLQANDVPIALFPAKGAVTFRRAA